MGTKLREYHVVEDSDGYRKGWSIVDEYGDYVHDTQHILFDTHAEARREADRMHAEDLDNYDGPPDGEAWSGGFAENH